MLTRFNQLSISTNTFIPGLQRPFFFMRSMGSLPIGNIGVPADSPFGEVSLAFFNDARVYPVRFALIVMIGMQSSAIGD